MKRISPSPLLLYALPLLFVSGTVTIFLARYLLSIYHPEYFAQNNPSISRTAAFEPGATFFSVGITLTSFFGLICWYFFFHLHRQFQAKMAVKHFDLKVLNWLSTSIGVAACLFLALLGLVNSNINGPLHESFSIAFFTAQIFSFLFDNWLWLRTAKKQPPSAEDQSDLRRKTLLVKVTLILGLTMLGLYLVDKADWITDETTLDRVFCYIEYLVSMLCFAFPLIYYPIVRRHYTKNSQWI